MNGNKKRIIPVELDLEYLIIILHLFEMENQTKFHYYVINKM